LNSKKDATQNQICPKTEFSEVQSKEQQLNHKEYLNSNTDRKETGMEGHTKSTMSTNVGGGLMDSNLEFERNLL
jgi:hypothetical protein